MKTKSQGKRLELFGPFLVPAEDIRFAGWPCPRCRRPVRYIGKVLPGLAPRMMFHACKCGTVTTWEDDKTTNPESVVEQP